MMELNTKYGFMGGCTDLDYFSDGSVKSANFTQENVISFGFVQLIPQYGDENERKKYIKAVSFYQNGELRRIALDKQTEVMTPIGEFPAELLTFYEEGSVKRVFPLNGKISGFWSEKDEGELATPFHFEFEFGEFTAKIINIHFYQSGDIKSITLFPGEVISLNTPVGKMDVRTGFSLYEDGTLKSVEPASTVMVATKIGKISAFDVSAIGIHADSNSLKFGEDGSVQEITTSASRVVVQSEGVAMETIEPIVKPNPVEEDEMIVIPVKICFSGETVVLTNEKEYTYALENSTFTILASKNSAASGCTDCSTCSGCH